MTTEEAAQDPKRNPKKRRANHTQKQHTTTTPKSGTAAKHPKAHRTKKRQQAKKNPQSKIKARSGRKTKPGKAAKHPTKAGKPEKLPAIDTGTANRWTAGNAQSIRGTAEADTGTATDNATEGPQRPETAKGRRSTHQKPKTRPRSKF